MKRFRDVGALGEYRDVAHFSLCLERFTPPGAFAPSRVPAVTITTYSRGTLVEIEALARAVAEVHPWEHPVVHCMGSEGSWVWLPEAPIAE